MAEKNSKGTGKFFLGAVLGAIAGAVAGKFISSKGQCECDEGCECDRDCECEGEGDEKSCHPEKEKVTTAKKTEKKTTKKEA